MAFAVISSIKLKKKLFSFITNRNFISFRPRVDYTGALKLSLAADLLNRIYECSSLHILAN